MYDATLHSTIEMIHRAYGDEFLFWDALVTNRIPLAVREAYRTVAKELALQGESHWSDDLASLEEDGAKFDYERAIEVASCLVDANQGVFTANAKEKSYKPIVHRIRAGVLDVLDAAQIALTPGTEAIIGAELVECLTGRKALNQFDIYLTWLADIRSRHEQYRLSNTWVPARIALIEQIPGHLFERNNHGQYRFGLSFRQFLLNCLFQECVRRQLPCRNERGPRAAFQSLKLERIKEIFERALSDWTSLQITPHEKKTLNYLTRDVVPLIQ